MISNYITHNRHAKVKAEIAELGIKKADLQRQISSLGITSNMARKRSSHIDERSWMVRDNCLAEIKTIDEKIAALQKERLSLHAGNDSSKNNKVREVLNEIFDSSQRRQIYEEAHRREAGEHAIPIGFSFKELERYKNGFYDYRDLAKQQVEKMIEFRILLTGLIEKGCEQFGNAEFLKFISPLNQLIIPLNELRKIKLKHLL